MRFPQDNQRWSIYFPGDSAGDFDGVAADFLRSTLQLTFVAPVFDGPPEGSHVSVPAAISGIVTGMTCQDLWLCQARGPVWAVRVSGAGNLDLDGETITDIDVIWVAHFAFTGTATSIPEPSTLAMISSGVLGLVGLCRRMKA